MSQTLLLIRELVARQEVRISDHGYDELAEDDILVSDIFAGVTDVVMVEDYPEYYKGPCCAGCSKSCNLSSSCRQAQYRAMDRRFSEEDSMTRRRRTKFIHEGQYAAEVDVELIESQDGWAPYLSLEDAQKLDEVHATLRQSDLQRARTMARIFKLTPVAG